MTPAHDGQPQVERSARGLGVRLTGTVLDLKEDGEGFVDFGSGGLSVAPCSYWKLPAHRRPRPLGRGSTGHTTDRIYRLALTRVPNRELAVKADTTNPFRHATIEAAMRMRVDAFDLAVKATRQDWVQVWP